MLWSLVWSGLVVVCGGNKRKRPGSMYRKAAVMPPHRARMQQTTNEPEQREREKRMPAEWGYPSSSSLPFTWLGLQVSTEPTTTRVVIIQPTSFLFSCLELFCGLQWPHSYYFFLPVCKRNPINHLPQSRTGINCIFLIAMPLGEDNNNTIAIAIAHWLFAH